MGRAGGGGERLVGGGGGGEMGRGAGVGGGWRSYFAQSHVIGTDITVRAQPR